MASSPSLGASDEKDSIEKRSYEVVLDADEALLKQLGYKQELRRTFTPLELFGVGFGIIGVVPSVASILVYAIPNGGPSAMIWGWAVCTVGLMAISAAIAELGSAMPTSGGLYYWTYSFSSPQYKTILAWMVGYSNTIGNLAAVASVEWGFSLQLMATITIATHGAFIPTRGQIYGVYVAALLVHGTICSVGAVKYIARVQSLITTLNVVLALVVIIALPAATPQKFKNTAAYAFGGFENFSGWPDGFAFLLSFLAPLWAVGAFDSSTHLSEEAKNANVAVPWALMSMTSVACALGWGVVVSIVFNMGTDLEAILASDIGQPMAAILFNSFGREGTLAVWIVVVLLQFAMGVDMLIVCSRQNYAFSRDGALPLSRVIRRVNPTSGTPVYAVWFAVFVSALLGLLSFAGPAAIGAIFSLVVVGQFTAYSIPICARFLGKNSFKPGPFTLGRAGAPIGFGAVVFMSFTSVVFLFPATPGPSSATMNYTVAVWGGTLALAAIYFYLPKYGGRNWFTGPISNVTEMGCPARRIDKTRDLE
ncbi:amino acid transporter [Peniophora sp. CONT]|nr:amino acid transporter [Peniophora sp. CONT]